MTTETGPEAGLNAAMAATLNGERVANGMTFDALAEATGIPKRTLLRKVSTVERHLNIEDVRRIAQAFGLTVAEVMVRAEDRLARKQGEVVELPLSDEAPSVGLAIAAHEDGSIAGEQESTNET